jgi:hypothetical protein
MPLLILAGRIYDHKLCFKLKKSGIEMYKEKKGFVLDINIILRSDDEI